MNDPTRFANLNDLARLPYFEVRDGRLALADPALGPAVDLHTHLALAYGPRATVDLLGAHEHTEHYLPRDRPIDLDVYINKNFLDADLKALSRDLTAASFTAGGMRRTHTLPNLTREMREVGVRHACLLPIDYPFWSRNAERWCEITRGQTEAICFGSVHPYEPDMEGRLDAQRSMGIRGVKVHPAVQVVRPDDRRAMKLFRLCGERGLPVLLHCGPVGIEPLLQRYLTQVRHYEKAVAENPGTTFLLGHSGAMQMPQALWFAKKYPNVYLELSSQSLSGVKRILDEGPEDRIVYGSDWPFYHQAIGLAKVFLATEGREGLRKKVLWGNAARLLGLEESGGAAG